MFISKSRKRHSLPIRAFFYALRIPGRIFNRFIFYPSLDRKITNSDLELFVHDKQRGLIRVINYGERLHWALDSGKVCDAVPWLDRIEPLISSNDIVFDIGANIGVVTNWFAHRCQHVHAFEPHPDNFEKIKSQKKLRNMNNITVHDIALGKEKSRMQLHVKEFHGHHSLGDVVSSQTVGKIEVNVRTVDAISEELKIDKINFMKIDVEGFESDVLRGASRLLQNKKIDYILFELQDTILHSINRTSKEVFQIIFDAGYQIIDLNGNSIVDSTSTISNGDYLACLDGIATAKKLAPSDYELK